MGYIKHHAIAIVTWNKEEADKVYKKAIELFNGFDKAIEAKPTRKLGKRFVTKPMSCPINSYYSLFIAPDGSKEGWGHSKEGEKLRNELLDWIDKEMSSVDYALIRFGGDDASINFGVERTECGMVTPVSMSVINVD